MSLGDHLRELRKRLFIAAAAILVGAGVGIWQADLILDAIRAPLERIAATHPDADVDFSLFYGTITGSFDLRMQVGLTVGVVITSPVWLYQVFAFLVPGLKRRERRFTLAFFISAVPLFIAGCAAGWFVLPNIVRLMLGFVPAQDIPLLDAKLYYDFVLKLVLAVGIAFVVPVFIVLLNFAGILSAAAIIKGWRVAVLTITLFTAIATPAADVMSMFLLAVPMVVLYFAAWFIAWLHDRRVAKRQRAEFGTAFAEG
ncbi:twin-arginine translocase subunit TatC [Agromyces archimandritae]|uniref:Sec-independent protein translocase protein TatC n=1 Tax=Agromyces archimandritae TaxID=2781962 RepID=A0A975FPT4_9MICO|nr:twin-arginine translocase subunit TatC [Agromyces archimandritae]QTX06069.1 twin-arginine translocase subunit TatC [Agromyces archimandritae]